MVPESDGARDAGRRACPLQPAPGTSPSPLTPALSRQGRGSLTDGRETHSSLTPALSLQGRGGGFFICSRLTEPDVRAITPPMILQSRPSFLYKNSGDL